MKGYLTEQQQFDAAVQYLRGLVVEGSFRIAIELLQDHLNPYSKKTKTFTVLQSRYNAFSNDMILGHLDSIQRQKTRNELTISLTELIFGLRKADFAKIPEIAIAPSIQGTENPSNLDNEVGKIASKNEEREHQTKKESIQTASQPQKGNRNRSVLLVIFLFLSILINVWLAYTKVSLEKKSNSLISLNDSLNQELQILLTENEELKKGKELKKAKAGNASLSSQNPSTILAENTDAGLTDDTPPSAAGKKTSKDKPVVEKGNIDQSPTKTMKFVNYVNGIEIWAVIGGEKIYAEDGRLTIPDDGKKIYVLINFRYGEYTTQQKIAIQDELEIPESIIKETKLSPD